MTTRPDRGPDVRTLAPRTIELRRLLHQRPELAFEETFTAALLAERMRAADLAVTEGLAGTGVLAVLEGSAPGKTLLVRADIDGVPMDEAPGRDYGSQIANRNHCCGHDANSAVVAGVAEVLARHRDAFSGRLAFIFQPADEPMRGAQRMIDDGLFDLISPDISFGVHVLPMAEAGRAVIQPGPIWASRDVLILKLSGQGNSLESGPGLDAVRLAARLVTELYEMVEREADSQEAVTFRIRSLKTEQGFAGGSNRAEIECNLALFDNSLRPTLLERIRSLSAEIVQAAGAELTVEVDYALPALLNDADVVRRIAEAAEPIIGKENIITGWRNPFGDDFSLFMSAAPGCFMLLGTGSAEKGITAAWHASEFDIDEAALPIGVQIMSQAALRLLE